MSSILDNSILAGDYKNKLISFGFKGNVYISIGFKNKLFLNKDTVKSYELQPGYEANNTASVVKRGALGGLLFGGAGAIVGASTAKSKRLYRLAIDFKDGKRSLAQMDQQTYDFFTEGMF